MLIEENNYLAHYGILRRSGRYPWGSGGNAPATSRDFLSMIDNMRRQGMSDKQIAQGFDISMIDLRAAKTIALAEKRQSDITMAQGLRKKGMSLQAIGERLQVSEGTVRNLLAPGAKDKADNIQTTANLLRKEVDKHGLVDVGKGTENYLRVSPERLTVALAVLKQEGYEVHSGIKVPQAGGPKGNMTNLKVLAKPGTTWTDVARNKHSIRLLQEKLDDTGKGTIGLLPIIPISERKVAVRWKEDGGEEADGVLWVRPGVERVSLGDANYAQVRVQVGKSHYMKGMAMYKDDLPEGIDIVFNSNKPRSSKKTDAFKPLADDPENPFGTWIRGQVTKVGRDGVEKNTSVMNLVNEEGDWSKWSKSVASQVLSKQSPRVAREQLDMTYERRLNEFEMITKLTNPVVKKKLLESFADSVESSSVDLKAANFPKQGWHAILPISSMKPTEIYAPNYESGTNVVLIRYPHGGTFEIPSLVVNNKHPEAKKLLGAAKDAVGIHHSVAEHLSGADFDGDTVLVIPNDSGKIRHTPILEGLKNFNPKEEYKGYPGMKTMTNTQLEMGKISNLITDMTIRKAPQSEMARAVRHSMVVIDAEKHGLNYKESEKRNGIAQLQQKYQPKPDGKGSGGASTLISKGSATVYLPERRLRKASEGGAFDPKTGRRVFVETGKKNLEGEPVVRGYKALDTTEDAHTLSSGTRIETLYADHSNRLKQLAAEARVEAHNTPMPKRSPSARKVYASEVAALSEDLTTAKSNAPLERRANLLTDEVMRAKKAADPDMSNASYTKQRYQVLAEMRRRTGAKKELVQISDRQWEAIQAGAVSPSMLKEILAHTDLERVKELAIPKQQKLMTPAKIARAKTMLAQGYNRAEVARHLGVSTTTLDEGTGGG